MAPNLLTLLFSINLICYLILIIVWFMCHLCPDIFAFRKKPAEISLLEEDDGIVRFKFDNRIWSIIILNAYAWGLGLLFTPNYTNSGLMIIAITASTTLSLFIILISKNWKRITNLDKKNRNFIFLSIISGLTIKISGFITIAVTHNFINVSISSIYANISIFSGTAIVLAALLVKFT